MSTACAAFMATAVLAMPTLQTWRCSGCRRIVLRLQYDGRSVIEHVCKCNRPNRLPDDSDRLRYEEQRR